MNEFETSWWIGSMDETKDVSRMHASLWARRQHWRCLHGERLLVPDPDISPDTFVSSHRPTLRLSDCAWDTELSDVGPWRQRLSNTVGRAKLLPHVRFSGILAGLAPLLFRDVFQLHISQSDDLLGCTFWVLSRGNLHFLVGLLVISCNPPLKYDLNWFLPPPLLWS